MKSTKLPVRMVTKLERIAERSRQDPNCVFNWLMQHYSKENLTACFHELDERKAVGIDKQTKGDYAENLEANIDSLVARMKAFSYHPQPVRQVLIPKSNGGQRPLGIASIEDKIVQLATQKILEAIYEPIFLDGSLGFRPGRSCHQAIKRVHDFLCSNWRPTVLEIDFESYFGTINHRIIVDMLRLRIKDETFLRYMVRMLKTGILTADGFKGTDVGTPQGSIASPILANIFAHYAIDVWFSQVAERHLARQAEMVRYCDDAVFLFNDRIDGERFMKALKGRVAKFGLRLNPTKTHLLTIDKHARQRGVKQPTFSFLGFTFLVGKTRKGRAIPKLVSESQRARAKLLEIKLWLKAARHKLRLKQLWDLLRHRVRGYIGYFAITHNTPAVARFVRLCTKMFFKWINRRSQRKSLTWEKFQLFLATNPMPPVRVKFALFTAR